MSETAVCREHLAPFCTGTGTDLGCGDDLIVPHAIGIDLRQLGKTNIVGDCGDLSKWFQHDSLDFCFSSHMLEDREDTTGTLFEWLYVLKRGGYLVLFLPDQKTYLAHCKKHGTVPNQDHKHDHFSMKYVVSCLRDLGIESGDIVHRAFPVGTYSFELVVKKPLRG